MDKEIARALRPLVNDREIMALLEIYMQHRIDKRYKDMEDCHMHDLKGHQDAIKELRRFLTLKKEVLERSKGE